MNKYGTTALHYSIEKKMGWKIASKIIKTRKARLEQVTKSGKQTALIKACINKNPKTALIILKTGKGKPEHVDKVGLNALEWACTSYNDKKMEKVALKILETGKGHPEHITTENRNTLSYACTNKMNKVALKLLEMGTSNPGLISKSNSNNTPLITACREKMTDVALKLLETGKAKPDHVNKQGLSALYWANKNNLPAKLKRGLCRGFHPLTPV